MGNDDEGDHMITSHIDHEDVDITVNAGGKDEAFAAFIQSEDSLERDISPIIYERAFELIPFISSYLDLKP